MGSALDPFEGGVDPQANHDIEQLGKIRLCACFFKNNDESWMRASLEVSNIDNVDVIKIDGPKFDYIRCGPIAFAFLDVDLYQPIIHIGKGL